MKKEFSDRREDFFQFVWHHQLYTSDSWKTTTGKHVEVLFPGYPNKYSGPDFLNARIRIDDLLWVGHVEIHVKSSEWDIHGHQTDPAYDNVILHVVHFDNKNIVNSRGQPIPTLVTENSINPRVSSGWENWLKTPKLPCSPHLDSIPDIEKGLWLDALYAQRLERKTRRVAKRFLSVDGHSGELIYRLTARYLGGHLNSAPMSRLAGIIPFSWVTGIEQEILSSILLGAAGWLNEVDDAYLIECRETYLLFSKLTHHPGMKKHEWKWSHMFMGGSPVLRITQLAGMTEGEFFKEDYILQESIDKIIDDLKAMVLPDYWTRHYLPGVASSRKLSGPGKGMAERWLINVVAPYCNMKARKTGDLGLMDRVEYLLEKCSPENNRIVQQWVDIGWEPENARESQAMIELTKTLCTQRKCLNCRIGKKILMSDD